MQKVLMHVTNQRVVGLLLLVVSGLYIYYIRDIPLDFWSESEAFNARTMPSLFGYGAVITSVLLIVLPGRSFPWSSLKNLNYAPALALLALLSFYSLAIDNLGFIVTTSMFLFGGFFILGERRLVKMSVVALAITLAFYFGLSALDIYLSPGEFWTDNA